MQRIFIFDNIVYMGRGGKKDKRGTGSALSVRSSALHSEPDFVINGEGISLKSRRLEEPGPWIRSWYGKDFQSLDDIVEVSYEEKESGQKAVASISIGPMGPSITTEVAYSKSKNKNGKYLVAIRTTEFSEPTQDDTGGLMVIRYSRKPLNVQEEVIEVDPREIVDIEKIAREKIGSYVEQKEAAHLEKLNAQQAKRAKELEEEMAKDHAELEIEELLGKSSKKQQPRPNNII